MSALCLLFAWGLLAQNPCARPTPYEVGYVDANDDSRIEVETAITITNEHLRAAAISKYLVYRTTNDKTSLPDNAIAVYLVVLPGSAVATIKEIKRVKAKVLEFQAQDFQMDPAFATCDDSDDCVENLYKSPNVTTVVIETLERITNSHVAEADDECKCIVLFARDLQRYQAVFGTPWARFILTARYAGESIPEALKIPEIMQEDNGLALRWLLISVLLHEVGHHQDEFMFDDPQGSGREALQRYRLLLGSARKKEEARADAFAADVMRKSCFSPTATSDAKHSCVATAYSTTIFFGITLWGKTKEARCVRYLDPSNDYPNFHLRSLVRDAQAFDDKSSISLLEDFLKIREDLNKKDWIKEVPRCHKSIDLNSSM